MRKLISKDILTETLRQEGYEYFGDEQCRIVTIDYLVPLLYHKYLNSVADIWNFSIEKEKLVCKNISGMEIRFPLMKDKN